MNKLSNFEPMPLVIAGNSDDLEPTPVVVARQAVLNPIETHIARLDALAKPIVASMIKRTNGHSIPIYIFRGAIGVAEGEQLERRLAQSMPQLEHVDSLKQLNELPGQSYLLFPCSNVSMDRPIDTVASWRDDLFFIFISDEISASDYKRLVRTGQADWVSARDAPQEILDIIATRHQRSTTTAEPVDRRELVLVSLLPSGGGVGNATLAVETAVQIKTHKATKGLAVCLIDLDFQTGHVCDLLDIDARLKVAEISQSPDRLDAQLLDLFVSRHASGLDVVAAPRSKDPSAELSIAALDALFAMLSQRYDLVLVDLPVHWVSWTRQILSVSNLTIVTGSNTIPGLRQVVDAIKTIQRLEHPPAQIAVALNRCKSRLIGGVVGQRFVKRTLVTQRVLYVREDRAAAQRSANTGVPVSLGSPLSRISKDIAKLGALVCALKPGPLAAVM